MYSRPTQKINNYNNSTFVAVVCLGTRISFLFARCRYLPIFGILLLNIRHGTKIGNIVTNL